MIYNIADFNIDINTDDINIKRYFNSFESKLNDKSIDFRVNITEENIKFEEEFIKSENENYSDYDIKRTVILRKLAEWLPKHNSIIFHSALFDVEGTGVAFAAHSGTGKTTHMVIWKKVLGDKMTIVNGDKPIIRFFDKEPTVPYAYGNPWYGKENIGCNMRTPLKHICFIERSKTNSAQKLDPNSVIELMFNQIYKPTEPLCVLKTMEIVDRLIKNCAFWKIKCNISCEAAEIAYRTIFNQQSIL